MKNIILPEKLSSAAVCDLIKMLKEQSGGVVLDGRNVIALGSLAAEIILRFKKQVEESGLTFEIKVSDKFIDDLQTIGLYEFLLPGDTEK